jgi:cation transporter-like permease
MMRLLLPHRKLAASVLLSAGLASIALLGGFGIQAVRRELLSFTPLLIALPAMNAITGDYATLITAHLGDPETYRERVKKLILSLAISVPVSIAGVTTMSLLVASRQGFIISGAAVQQYVVLLTVALVAILSLTLLSIVVINYIVKHKRINSDDILIPVANTIASVLVLASFAIIALRLH